MDSEKTALTAKAYRAVFLWAAAVILLYSAAGYLATRQLAEYKVQSARLRQSLLDTTLTGDSLPNEKTPVVRVGIYLNRISEVAVRESGWTADFDLWFRWNDPRLKPGETFQISNGEIEDREKRESIVNGADRYERYRVKARMAKQFNSTRFPFVDEPLIIRVEDSVHRADALRWVADKENSGVSPTAMSSDVVDVRQTLMGVRLHDIGSTLGQSLDGLERPDVRSEFVFTTLLSPPGVRFYFKLFNVLFFSVAIAFLSLFIKPTHVDPRFGLGTGAVFAVIGNTIVLSSQLPMSGQITLADMVNAVALGTIVLTLIQSTISLYVYDSLGLERLSRFFDKVSFVAMILGFVSLVVALPLAAR